MRVRHGRRASACRASRISVQEFQRRRLPPLPFPPCKISPTTPIRTTMPATSPTALSASPDSGYCGSIFTPKSYKAWHWGR